MYNLTTIDKTATSIDKAIFEAEQDFQCNVLESKKEIKDDLRILGFTVVRSKLNPSEAIFIKKS
jgi:hypothetical protein